MARASTLFGGGGALPYASGVIYPCTKIPFATGTSGNSAPNEDWLMPFSPRKTVALDAVVWQRDGATAANVYVGIYSADGTLLTDCAVDADTTIGLHAVSTSEIALLATELYYFAWNASSANVASFLGNDLAAQYDFASDVGYHANIAGNVNRGTVAYSKARSNAALPASQTMSGWSAENKAVFMGFRVS